MGPAELVAFLYEGRLATVDFISAADGLVVASQGERHRFLSQPTLNRRALKVDSRLGDIECGRFADRCVALFDQTSGVAIHRLVQVMPEPHWSIVKRAVLSSRLYGNVAHPAAVRSFRLKKKRITRVISHQKASYPAAWK